jgi:hypothetical protein
MPGEHTLHAGMTELVAPRNELEAKLAEIWAQTLGLPQVGVCDDFFGIGGQSLQAVQLAHRLSTTLGIPISPIRIFESPTIEALAVHIARTEVLRGQELDDVEQLTDAQVDALLRDTVANKRPR